MSGRRDARAVAMEQRVDRQMSDTRFNRLRGRTGRRALVAAMTVAIALMPVAWVVGGSL